jgi:hypothetical protein
MSKRKLIIDRVTGEVLNAVLADDGWHPAGTSTSSTISGARDQEIASSAGGSSAHRGQFLRRLLRR